MIAGEAVIKGVLDLKKNLDKYEFSMAKNMNTAFRVTGYRLKNKLQKEIRAGAPGGSKFSPLTVIASRWFYTKRRKSGALARLAIGVRYHIPNTITPMLQVGFVGPTNYREYIEMVNSGFKFGNSGTSYRGLDPKNMTSKSWRRLADIHQRGFKKNVTEPMRLSLYRWADKVRGPDSRYFRIKKSTTQFENTPRLIIDPFWDNNRDDAIKEIRVNWERKMRGERI